MKVFPPLFIGSSVLDTIAFALEQRPGDGICPLETTAILPKRNWFRLVSADIIGSIDIGLFEPKFFTRNKLIKANCITAGRKQMKVVSGK